MRGLFSKHSQMDNTQKGDKINSIDLSNTSLEISYICNNTWYFALSLFPSTMMYDCLRVAFRRYLRYLPTNPENSLPFSVLHVLGVLQSGIQVPTRLHVYGIYYVWIYAKLHLIDKSSISWAYHSTSRITCRPLGILSRPRRVNSWVSGNPLNPPPELLSLHRKVDILLYI
jgi:hypothetical protein